MKILFVSPEFEEQARGITGIIKSMIRAARADGHEVGVLVGYPMVSNKQGEHLSSKVEHIYLQHYLQSGKKNLFPSGLRGKKTQLKIIAGQEYLKVNEVRINHDLVRNDNLATNLDYIIKIPYVYQFINHGLEKIAKRTLKRAVKKFKIDLVITGAPMAITSKDVAPAKLAQFVHDTMPLDLMETPPDNGTPQRFARQLYAAASESNLVFTNSEDTRNKVLEVNSEANVQVVYGVASNKPNNLPETLILEKNNLTPKNYLLFISVLEKRKNLGVLFDAYAMVHKEIKMPLVIVGGKGYGYEDIMSHYNNMPEDVKKNIIFTGFISEADKYTLLNNANTFVFPSIYEGIGLPIIEAFNSNLVVLTSNRGALPEAGGKAAHYVNDPYDVGEVANAIKEITEDEELRGKLLKNMQAQVKKFTWEKFNERFAEGLKKLR